VFVLNQRNDCTLGPVLWVQFSSFRLDEHREDACDDREEGNTFYEGSRQDHTGTDVVHSFRLTCDGFHCTLTDLADTDTGTDRSKACTQGSACVGPSRSTQQYE